MSTCNHRWVREKRHDADGAVVVRCRLCGAEGVMKGGVVVVRESWRRG